MNREKKKNKTKNKKKWKNQKQRSTKPLSIWKKIYKKKKIKSKIWKSWTSRLWGLQMYELQGTNCIFKIGAIFKKKKMWE